MFSKRLGIDLGTANSLVYLEGKGVVLNEPTVVAITIEDGTVVAVGNEAKEMLGRTPEGVTASRPLRDGVIADYAVTEAMLRYFMEKVLGARRFFKPEVMICVPAGVTQVERRAVLDATMSAGAKTAYLIDEPLAASIGAKIPIALPSGNMIIDIGGGSTEAAVISLGGVVVHNSVRVAGNKIDEAITSYIRRKYNLIIGERTAEEIKINIGSATPLEESVTFEVRGRDSISGLPRVVEITSEEVTEAIQLPLKQIVDGIKLVLEQTPPELSSDIIDKGIVLSGGTALLKNLDKLFSQELGVPAQVADNPLLCVVQGTGVALENIDLYKRSITKK
ncbi:MAG: rod shape-determining protein [Candidatus Woykebacteria bacterium RBG_13_40_7b]|uniref:Cell shape-determining protein MreB n=1 Tax=Candidatus Woykebacteria bacterium RBG_13_40_7b TaxID=1802594 RepID=A0A1G1WA06_9BACT|nr:MAG: rod shape-determining protein [Candidatus Woykebacteria bacterium RBG_13_40_7b]